MKFYSLVIFISVANSFSLAQTSNFYKSLSYSQGIQIFANSYGLQLSVNKENETGLVKMKNCLVRYSFDKSQQLFTVDVKKSDQNYIYKFWSHFQDGVPSIGGSSGTPVLPLLQMNRVIGFVALNRIGIDCETQGCWQEQTVRLFVRPGSLVIQDVGPEPSRYYRPSVETVRCNQN